MNENSNGAFENFHKLIKGDLKSSVIPPILGIFAGLIAAYIDLSFQERGYLSIQYYIGVAFQFQLIIFIAFLVGLPLYFFESRRFEVSFKDLILGSIFCNFICFLMAYGHGFFPLLLMIYLQWLWICYFWQKKLIPPFRYAIWISLGLICGGMAGSILAQNLF